MLQYVRPLVESARVDRHCMKKPGALRHHQVQRHRRRPGTLAVYHDTAAVASKRPNVPLDPLEHHRLVVYPEQSGGVIARARAQSRRREESEDACSVGRRYEHDILPAWRTRNSHIFLQN
jgi:hypothetical protein